MHSGDDGTRMTRFSRSFLDNVRKLVTLLFSDGGHNHAGGIQSLSAISIFPSFLRDMLNLIDRGVVFSMVRVLHCIGAKHYILISYSQTPIGLGLHNKLEGDTCTPRHIQILILSF